jgi:hypothetical protein
MCGYVGTAIAAYRATLCINLADVVSYYIACQTSNYGTGPPNIAVAIRSLCVIYATLMCNICNRPILILQC